MLLFLLACAGCPPGGSTQGPPVATAAHPDVVFVTLDTTRADHLGAYGDKEAVTPTIDALAARGVRYDQAYAPVPLTIPSHATLMTGLYPHHHGIRQNGDNVLADSFTTLAERFKAAGYVTAASVGAFVTTRQWGFAQGFDAYFDALPDSANRNFWHLERSGDTVVDDALGWFEANDGSAPVFLWVHLYDAHFPYVSHTGQPPDLAARPYDAELNFVDQQVKRLVDAFASRDVIFVLVGDHGEALGEHHESTHGLFAYSATQHVPWIMSGAGITPAVHTAPVSTVDVAATVLSAAGLPLTEGGDGLPAPSADPAPAYSESWQLPERLKIAPQRTLVDGTLRYVATPKPELYDLVADPRETTNLADQRPDDVARLQGKLDALGVTPPQAGSNVDAATISQLAALGYVAGGGVDGAAALAFPDAKDYLDVIDQLDQIERNPDMPADQKLAILAHAVERKPDALEPRFRQLPLLAAANRLDEAKALMEETAKVAPDNARVWVSLAGIALANGDKPGALELARRAIAAEPDNDAAQEQVIDLLLQNRKSEEAVPMAQAFLQRNPKNYGLAAVLGRYYLFHREAEEAVKYLALAVQAPSPRRGARVQLAWLMKANRQPEKAYPLLEAELKDFPDDFLSHRMLAELHGTQKNWAAQLPHLQAIAKGRTSDAGALLWLAQCEFNLQGYDRARQVLDRALALAPDNPDVLLLDANLLSKEGQAEKAKEVFARADALNTERVKKAEKALAPSDPSTAGVLPDDAAPGATP